MIRIIDLSTIFKKEVFIMERNKERMSFWFTMLCCVVFITSVATGQNVILQDDFSGDLSNWQELGNAGVPEIVDGELRLEWGYAPTWFVTQDEFNFGSDALLFDFTFVGGGYQASSNYKQNYVYPLLGANDIESENGAVRASFSADFFDLARWAEDADGNLVWEDIPLAGDEVSLSIQPGDRVRFEIDPSGQRGSMYLNGVQFLEFLTVPVLEGGVGFRVVTDTRDVIVDDVYFAQIDENGNETVVFEDEFERSELGSEWINETFAADPSPGPLDAYIQDGMLHLDNDGSGDSWLRTEAQVDFEGMTTIFEYTFVDFLNENTYLPTVVLGTKPYESDITSGVILVDNGTGFNYGMVNGGWSTGQASQLGGNRPGMRVKIVVDPGGQSGTVYRDNVEALRFFNIGPTFSGGFAFRTIVDRDATIDDVRIYTLEEDGSETTIFEDDFNREEIGDDWLTESITPDVPPGAQWSMLEDRDDDGNNELFLDHDSTTDDAWFRLTQDLPFGEGKAVVFECTYVDFVDYASVVVGSSEWIPNEIVGPILLDNLDTPWVMDTLQGNVWVRPGPVSGSKISLQVNSDGRSGAFLVNDIAIRNWEFAEGEDPIPVGSVGFQDPFDTPQTNESPPAEPDTVAAVFFDDVSVSLTQDTAVHNWMLH